jgi:hypothetical protein
MSSLSQAKRKLRKRSEQHLRHAVLSELGRGQPSTVEPYKPDGGRLWSALFVPLYRRVPWRVKEKAMGILGMTAQGWKAPERRPAKPWRPPPELADRVRAAQAGTAATTAEAAEAQAEGAAPAATAKAAEAADPATTAEAAEAAAQTQGQEEEEAAAQMQGEAQTEARAEAAHADRDA